MTPLFGTILVVFAAAAADDGAVLVASAVLRASDEASIAAREAGTLARVAVREGQTIGAGELLAQIDDAESQLLAARATVEAEMARDRASNDVSTRLARKTLAVAEAELARAEFAVEQFAKSVSQTELDRLRLTVERDQLAVAQAEHELRLAQATLRMRELELELAQLKLERRRIIAPFGGIVAELKRQVGEWVEPGQEVVRILRVDRLRAEGFLEMQDADLDLVGHGVTLVVELPGKTASSYAGTVVFVSPEISPVNGQVLVRAEIDNADLALRPGRRGTLRIAP